MQIAQEEKRKKGTGNSEPVKIGYFKGELKFVNPTKEQVAEAYKMEEVAEEDPKYQGQADGKDWTMLRFLFEEEISKTPVEYRIFMAKEPAEFEVDNNGEKITKQWYVNQHGNTQVVADEKDLFESMTHLCTWSKEGSKFVKVLNESGDPISLQCRKAWKGETALYALLRRLIAVDWFKATDATNLFIRIEELMRGKVSDITNMIGTDTFQPVVGMIEIKAKDEEGEINYYQNCIDGAWMPGFRIKDANVATASKSWDRYENKANGKGKNREIYEFYQTVKRNKNMYEFSPIHEFNAADHIAATNSPIKHEADTSANDTDY